MVDSSHSISLAVDASSGVKSLSELKTAIKETGAALNSLGSTSGGFSALLGQINQLSAGFDKLKNQAASVNSVQASIGRMSAAPIKVVSAELGVLAAVARDAESAFGLLGTALSIGAMEKLGAGIQKAGSDLLSFKFALDSVATSSGEAAQELDFVQKTATATGGSLSEMTNGYRLLAASMRPLGNDVETIERVFKGFSQALTVNHASVAQQRRVFMELSEVYAQGAGHSQQLLRSIGSVIPGMSAQIQKAASVSSEGLHKLFREGGVPLTAITKLGDNLSEQYGRQIPDALNHSVAAVTLLGNVWTRIQQTAFESGGFDRGLTTLAQSLQISEGDIQKFGQAIGGAFEGLFSASAKALAVVREFKEPLKDFATAVIGIRAVTLGMSLLSVAASAAMSPLLLLAGAFVIVKANWSDIKEAFSHAGEVFDSANEGLKRYTAGWMDLHKAMLGAVELWTLAKGLFSGKSLAESKQIAGQSGLDFESGKSSGTKFFEGVYTEAKSYATQVKDLFADLLPDSVSGGTKNIEAEWKRIDEMNKPHGEAGAGQYAANQKHYDEINSDRALSTELEKLFLKLNPVTAALKSYREELQKISEMKGKTVDGQAITDSQINAMKDNAKQTALKDFAPQTEKIQALLDSVKIERDARAAVGDEKDALESERAVLTWKNEMLRRNVSVTQEEVNAVRELLKAQAAFGKESENGFKKFADESKDMTKTLNDSIKSSMDSIAEGISKIVVDGKGKFKSLGAAIRAELKDILKGQAKKLIDAGIKGLMSQAITGLGLDKIGGADGAAALKKALGLGQGALDSASKKLDDAVKTTDAMTVTAGTVYVNGTGPGGVGSGSAAPGSGSANGIPAGATGGQSFNVSGPSGAALGGIVPTPQTYTPASPMPVDLGSINGNTLTLAGFGAAGLGASSALGGGGQGNNGINPNSALAFLQIANLSKANAPTAQNIGVTPPQLSMNDWIKQQQGLAAGRPAQNTVYDAPSAAISGKASGSEDQRAKQLWDQLHSQGYNDNDSSKILGNVKAESHFNAAAVRKNDAGPGIDSVGIAQWNNGKDNDQVNGRRAKMERDVSGQYGGRNYNPLSTDEKYRGQINYIPREIAANPAYKAGLSKSDAAGFGADWEGYKRGNGSEAIRNAGQQEYMRKFGGSSNQSGIDNTPTGSIKPVDLSKSLDPALKSSATTWETSMAKASKASSSDFTADISKDIKSASSGSGGGAGLASGTGAANSGLGDIGNSGNAGGLSGDASSTMGALTGLAGSVAKLGTQSKVSAQGVAALAPQLASLLAKLASGLGGSLGGAGGAAASAGGLVGAFQEGGISTEPVSSAFWAGLPAFAEGTPNTSGGFMAQLHPNEAVIPLSRSRSIPVELNGAGGGNVTNVHNVSHVHVQAKDFDSFRLNKGQLATMTNQSMARMAARNG